MALKLKHQDNIFFVEGIVNPSTIKGFKSHLEFLLLFWQSVTLNMDGVESIDYNGIQVLREIYTNSLIVNKKFRVMGNGSDEINNQLQIIHSA